METRDLGIFSSVVLYTRNLLTFSLCLREYVNRAHKGRNMEIKNPKIILEGVRLITDAINTNANIKCIYFTRKEVLAMLPLGKLTSNTSFYKVNGKEMKIWSEAAHSSGLLGIDVLNNNIF